MTMLLGITNSDGFAISMIAILGISLSFVLVILVSIFRQSRKSRSETDDLIDEVQREEEVQPAGSGPKEEESKPWERKDDWWKADT
jgi:hypothetical protein